MALRQAAPWLFARVFLPSDASSPKRQCPLARPRSATSNSLVALAASLRNCFDNCLSVSCGVPLELELPSFVDAFGLLDNPIRLERLPVRTCVDCPSSLSQFLVMFFAQGTCCRRIEFCIVRLRACWNCRRPFAALDRCSRRRVRPSNSLERFLVAALCVPSARRTPCVRNSVLCRAPGMNTLLMASHALPRP